MEVVTIQSDAFKQIMDRLTSLESYFNHVAKKMPLSEQWLDLEDACKFLKVSKRTIQSSFTPCSCIRTLRYLREPHSAFIRSVAIISQPHKTCSFRSCIHKFSFPSAGQKNHAKTQRPPTPTQPPLKTKYNEENKEGLWKSLIKPFAKISSHRPCKVVQSFEKKISRPFGLYFFSKNLAIHQTHTLGRCISFH